MRQAQGSVTMPSKRHHGDPGVAGFLDRAVQRGRRGRVQHDRVVALQDHVLDLRGLLGRLVLGGGEAVGGGDDAVGDRLAGDGVPTRQHRLPPRVGGIVVAERDALVGGVGQRAERQRRDGGRGQHEAAVGHRSFSLYTSLAARLVCRCASPAATGCEPAICRKPHAMTSEALPDATPPATRLSERFQPLARAAPPIVRASSRGAEPPSDTSRSPRDPLAPASRGCAAPPSCCPPRNRTPA